MLQLNQNYKYYKSHKEVTENHIDDLSTILYQISDLCLKGVGKDDLTIDSNAFVVSLPRGTNYLHLMLEVFGQFFLIKSFIPTLKMYVVLEHEESILGSENIENFIASHFEINRDDYILLTDYNEILFKNIYLTEMNPSSHVLYDLLKIESAYWQDSFGPSKYFKKIAEELNKNFDKYKKYSTTVKNKKIFYSRKQSNSSIRKLSRMANFKKYLNNSYQSVFYEVSMKHNTDVYTRNVWGRYLSKDDETMIENFFKNMGYQVIDCSNYSVEEQISIAYNSTHIVGIAGAAFVNTIFCNSNANVISLNISDIQNFPFWIMPMSVNVNYISIPQNIMFDAEHATRFDGNDIIKMVLNQEQLFL